MSRTLQCLESFIHSAVVVVYGLQSQGCPSFGCVDSPKKRVIFLQENINIASEW